MRLTTLASVCGLLFSTAAVAANSQNINGHTVGAHAALTSLKTGKLSPRAGDTISVPMCQNSNCADCFGDGFKSCPDAKALCYHPDKLGGIEINCYLPGSDEFDDKVKELEKEGKLDDLMQELEQFMEDWEKENKGAAAGLGPQGLLVTGAVAAGVVVAMM